MSTRSIFFRAESRATAARNRRLLNEPPIQSATHDRGYSCSAGMRTNHGGHKDGLEEYRTENTDKEISLRPPCKRPSTDLRASVVNLF